MAIERFYLKTGDLLPVLEVVPYDANDEVVPIPEDATVVFNMRSSLTGTSRVDRGEATVTVEGENVTLGYEWQAGDTSVAGVFYAEFEWMNGSKPQTFPNTPEDEDDNEPHRLEVIISEGYG